MGHDSHRCAHREVAGIVLVSGTFRVATSASAAVCERDGIDICGPLAQHM